MPKAKYYVCVENGDIFRTDEREVAQAYNDDGSSYVIDAEAGTYFDGADLPEAPGVEDSDESIEG